MTVQFACSLTSQSNNSSRETVRVGVISCDADVKLWVCPVSFCASQSTDHSQFDTHKHIHSALYLFSNIRSAARPRLLELNNQDFYA